MEEARDLVDALDAEVGEGLIEDEEARGVAVVVHRQRHEQDQARHHALSARELGVVHGDRALAVEADADFQPDAADEAFSVLAQRVCTGHRDANVDPAELAQAQYIAPIAPDRIFDDADVRAARERQLLG